MMQLGRTESLQSDVESDAHQVASGASLPNTFTMQFDYTQAQMPETQNMQLLVNQSDHAFGRVPQTQVTEFDVASYAQKPTSVAHTQTMESDVASHPKRVTEFDVASYAQKPMSVTRTQTMESDVASHQMQVTEFDVASYAQKPMSVARTQTMESDVASQHPCAILEFQKVSPESRSGAHSPSSAREKSFDTVVESPATQSYNDIAPFNEEESAPSGREGSVVLDQASAGSLPSEVSRSEMLTNHSDNAKISSEPAVAWHGDRSDTMQYDGDAQACKLITGKSVQRAGILAVQAQKPASMSYILNNATGSRQDNSTTSGRMATENQAMPNSRDLTTSIQVASSKMITESSVPATIPKQVCSLRRLREKQPAPWAQSKRAKLSDADMCAKTVISKPVHTKMQRLSSTAIRQSIGHCLAPPERGLQVKVRGDGWGGGRGLHSAIITEADELTFTVIYDQGVSAWQETHVLREHCILQKQRGLTT